MFTEMYANIFIFHNDLHEGVIELWLQAFVCCMLTIKEPVQVALIVWQLYSLFYVFSIELEKRTH